MNRELRELFQADQADRQSISSDAPLEDWKSVAERDAARLKRCKELLAAGDVQEGTDYYHAAMLHHHSGDVENIWKAHQLALRAVELGNRNGRWLAAAAEDRWLLMQNKPQKYGTQYRADGTLFPVNPATTDEDRAEWSVPPLAKEYEGK